jgi:hypothetical protein
MLDQTGCGAFDMRSPDTEVTGMAIASSTGAQLERAEVYSRDSRGKKHKTIRHHMDEPCVECGVPRRSCASVNRLGRCCDACMHQHIVPIKETRSWAPRPVESSTRETMEERVAREGKIERIYASLTADERLVLEYQGKLQERVEVRTVIAAGDLVDYQRDGYTLIPGSDRMVERPGLPPLECVDVYGHECVSTERVAISGDGEWMDGNGNQRTVKRKTYAEIAAMLGKSISLVNKLVASAHAKLRTLAF